MPLWPWWLRPEVARLEEALVVKSETVAELQATLATRPQEAGTLSPPPATPAKRGFLAGLKWKGPRGRSDASQCSRSQCSVDPEDPRDLAAERKAVQELTRRLLAAEARLDAEAVQGCEASSRLEEEEARGRGTRTEVDFLEMALSAKSETLQALHARAVLCAEEVDEARAERDAMCAVAQEEEHAAEQGRCEELLAEVGAQASRCQQLEAVLASSGHDEVLFFEDALQQKSQLLKQAHAQLVEAAPPPRGK